MYEIKSSIRQAVKGGILVLCVVPGMCSLVTWICANFDANRMRSDRTIEMPNKRMLNWTFRSDELTTMRACSYPQIHFVTRRILLIPVQGILVFRWGLHDAYYASKPFLSYNVKLAAAKDRTYYIPPCWADAKTTITHLVIRLLCLALSAVRSRFMVSNLGIDSPSIVTSGSWR